MAAAPSIAIGSRGSTDAGGPSQGLARDVRDTRHNAAVNDDAQLLRIAHDIANAIGRRDVQALGAMLAPGFVHRSFSGATADATAFLDGVAGIPGEIAFVRLERITVDVGDDAALLTGIQHAQVKIDGQVVDDRRSFADFFVKTAGVWKLRAAADFPAAESDGGP